MSATTLTVAKTVSYRAVSMSVTMAMAFAATGSLKAAASFGLANLVVNSTIYFGFEKVWTLVSGRLAPSLSPAMA